MPPYRSDSVIHSYEVRLLRGFESSRFLISNKSGSYELYVVDRFADPMSIATLVQSDKPEFDIMAFDNMYYKWYLKYDHYHRKYHLLSYFDNAVEEPITIGEVLANSPIQIIQK